MSQESSISSIQEKLETLVGDLKELRTLDPKNEINSYCDDLLARVDLAVETVYTHLNKVQEDLNASIERYRSEKLAQFEVKMTATYNESWETLAEITMKEACNLKNRIKIEISNTNELNAEGLLEEVCQLRKELQVICEARRKQVFQDKFLLFKPRKTLLYGSGLIGHLIDNGISTIEIKRFDPLVTVNDDREDKVDCILMLGCGLIATTAYSESVRIWNKSGKLVAELNHGEENEEIQMVFSLNSWEAGSLACCLLSGIMVIWDLNPLTNPKYVPVKFKDTMSPIVSVKLLHDGRLIASLDDGVVVIFDALTYNEIARISDPDKTKGARALCPIGILSVEFVFLPFSDGTLVIMDPKGGKVLRRTRTGIIGIVSALVLNDGLVALGQKFKDDARIVIYDIIDEEKIYALECGSSTMCAIGGDYLLVCSGCSIQIWNAANKTLVKTIDSGRNSKITCARVAT